MWNGPITGNFLTDGKGVGTMDGWYLCLGNPVNDALSIYNGKNTPDLKGRFIAGYSGSGEYGSVGVASGGGDYVTLTSNNLPKHSHEAGTLITQSAGKHSHALMHDKDHRNGSGGNNTVTDVGVGFSKVAFTGDAGVHTHRITGDTRNAGGIYTYTEIPNPPKLYSGCTIWKYSCSTSDGTINTSEDLTSLGAPAMITEANAQTLDWATEYTGYKVYDSSMGESVGYTEYPHTTAFTLSSCTANSGYDPDHPNCIDPIHVDGVADNLPIRINEVWDVRPFDNRPAYYVLAFIMRIK
jgi:hypothetical protein